MSNRTLRVNELLQREISDILRKRYQSDSAAITITEVSVAPDLHDGRVFVSIIGDAEFAEKKMRWLRDLGPAISKELCRRVVLKYMPRMVYIHDKSAARASRLTMLLDAVEPATSEPAAGETPVAPKSESPEKSADQK